MPEDKEVLAISSESESVYQVIFQVSWLSSEHPMSVLPRRLVNVLRALTSTDLTVLRPGGRAEVTK